MSEAEFPAEAEQNPVVRWFQIVAGTVVLLGVATICYAILLTITYAIPYLFDYFPFHSGELFRVVITASAGMWAGATALKFIFPSVCRRAVFAILATLMVIAIIGGSVAMTVKETHQGWEGIMSSIVFLVMGASLLRGKDWDDLPGRKQTP
jgi:hypothetical protein